MGAGGYLAAKWAQPDIVVASAESEAEKTKRYLLYAALGLGAFLLWRRR
jgi:MYXO-CTERM domain-containing protein